MLITISSSAYSGDNAKDPLMLLYKAALEYDANFTASGFEQEAQYERLALARSRLLPGVKLKASLAYNAQVVEYEDAPPFFKNGHHNFSSNAVGIQITQPLYRKDRFEAYRQGKVEARQSNTLLAIAKQQLILDVGSNYFKVLLAKDREVLVNAEMSANKKLLTQAKRGFEVGSASITDVYEAQARFDLSVSEQIDEKKHLNIARRALATLTGIKSAWIGSTHQNSRLQTPSANMRYWVELASINNLNIHLAEHATEIAKHEIGRTWGVALPKVDLVFSYDKTSASGSNFDTGIDSSNRRIMIEANVPIYAGGAVRARLKQKRAEYSRAQHQLTATRRDTTFKVEEAYLSHESGAHRIKALQQALFSSQTSLTSMQRGFELGLRTGIDLLDSQRQLYAAKLALAEAQYNRLFDYLRLAALSGQLDVDNIRHIDSVLN
ncbi:MAG: TolC family outer membrane protein [Flavobacteriales bacterium]|nr:TolC family outer membrane protein [Flavobacteriales bacterium]